MFVNASVKFNLNLLRRYLNLKICNETTLQRRFDNTIPKHFSPKPPKVVMTLSVYDPPSKVMHLFFQLY
jgi:hypothetical protein